MSDDIDRATLVRQRLDWIDGCLKKQSISGNPRHYIVLFGWNQIRDRDRDYQIEIPPLPVELAVGATFWVIERSDSADLVAATVVKDEGDRVLVKHTTHPVQFYVPREELHQTPIPLRPLAIKRTDLNLYLGDELAAVWHSNRWRRLVEERKNGR